MGQTMDMTVGNSLKLILRFSIPLFIGNLFQQIYSLVDTMVAGYHLGDSAIAAIGATSAISALLIDFLSGMNSGYSIIVSQTFGAHDEDKLKKSVAAMIILNVWMTIILTGIMLVLIRPLLGILNIPKEIWSQAYIYIMVVCVGLVSTVCFNMFAGILRAVGNSWIPLLFLIITCVANIVLDILFVVFFDMGIAGLAFATVLAQAVSGMLCGIYLLRHYQYILPGRGEWFLSKDLMWEMFTIRFFMGLMLSVVQVGSIIQQGAINVLGEMVITAHTAARRIILMMVQPFLSMATAVSVFVGQNLGAGRLDRIRRSLQKTMGLSVVWGILACGLIFWSSGVLIKSITGTQSKQVMNLAEHYLRVHFLFYPALGILLCLRSALQALGQKLIPVMTGGIELVLKILAARWLIPHMGFHGVLYTEPAIWVLCTIILIMTYLVWYRKNI